MSPSNVELLAQGFAGWGKDNPANMRVIRVHVQARAKNGKVMDVHNVWIYEFSEGTLIRGWVYADTAVLRDTVEGVTPAFDDVRA
jgi:hypothetical protein